MQTFVILREEIICLLVLLYLFINAFSNRGRKSSYGFLLLCFFAIGHVGFDIVTVYTVNNLAIVSPIFNKAVHIIFYLFGALFCVELLRYILTLLYPQSIFSRLKYKWYWLFSAVYILIFSLLPIKYTQGTVTNYSDGVAAVTAFSIPAILYGLAIILLIAKYKKFGRQVLVGILPMVILLYALMLIEVYYTEILITGGCVTLVTIGIYFSLEDPIFLKRQNEKLQESKQKVDEINGILNERMNTIVSLNERIKEANLHLKRTLREE